MLWLVLLLVILFGGLGFAAHILWLGLILAAIVWVADAILGSRRL